MKLLLRFWQLAWKALASLTILLAVLAATGKLFLPHIGQYRGWVERWLSHHLNQPVRIGRLTGEWRGLGPELHLQQFRILDEEDEPVLDIGQIDVVFSPQSLFTSQSRLLQFVLRQATLEIRRMPDGNLKLSMSGFATKEQTGSRKGKGNLLTRLGSLRLVNSRLIMHWSDDAFPLVFEQVDALYTSSSNKVWAAAYLVPLGEATPIEIRLRHIRNQQRTELYLETKQLDLLPWAPPLLNRWVQLLKGKLNLQVWAILNQARLTEAWARFSLQNLGLEPPEPLQLDKERLVSPRYWRSRLGAHIHYRRQENEHDLQLLDLFSEGGDEIIEHGRGRIVWNEKQARLAVENLKLDGIDQLLRATVLSQTLEPWLPYESTPSGEIVWARANLERPSLRLQSADIQLRDLSFMPTGKRPGLAGLNTHLRLKNDHWRIQLVGNHFSLDYPHLFRDTLYFSTLHAEGSFDHDAKNWTLNLEPFTLINNDLQLQGRLLLRNKPGKSRPFVDMQAELRQVQAAGAWKYWPKHLFKPKLLQWLDQALLDGQANATFVLHGDLNHFPFRGQEGRFNFRVTTDDLQLRFHPQWPIGHIQQAEVEFDRSSMRVVQLQGDVSGFQVTQVQGGISDYRNALLDLKLRGQGDAHLARKLLDASPLHRLYSAQDEKFIVNGQIRTRMRLKVPLSPRAGQKHVSVDGHLNLSDGQLDLPIWGQHFEQLQGDLRYDHTGFSTIRMRGQTLNRFVDLQLCVAAHCLQPDVTLQADVSGQFPMENMIQQARVIDRLIPFMPGESQWKITVTVPRQGSATLHAETDLLGVTSLLPAPLHKQADQLMPLQLQLDLPPENGLLNLQLGKLLRIQVLEPGERNRCLVELGPDPTGLDPTGLEDESLLLKGTVDELDLSGWIAIRKELFGPADSTQQPWLTELDIQTETLHLLEHEIGRTRLHMRRENGFWKANLEGEQMQGVVQASVFPGPDDTLIAEFERIHWPKPRPDQLEQLGKQARQHDIRVSDIPRLHLLAQDFRLGHIELGEVRLEAYPIADGLRVERLQARSEELSLTASGDWLEEAEHTHSQFQIHLGVESLGSLLQRLGYDNLIEGGQTVANFDVNWPGPPTAFALERLGGDLNIQVGPGQILEIQPGAGRIFGLLSLQQLPRRLLLDFRDVFNRGLSFDKIVGHFRLEQGIAHTDDLKMESKTARILISGKTDLVQQRYDQTIVVIPHVGQALPAVGALTGGIAGAAAMLAIQGLIGKSLDESSGAIYRLTGTWSKPKIERVNLKKAAKGRPSETRPEGETARTPAEPTSDQE